LTYRVNGSIAVYRERLRRIFSECQRVLKLNGVFVFTYHHKRLAAWNGLGEALVRSGFRCIAALPLRIEGQGGLHSYGETIKWDAVFVCRKDSQMPSGESCPVVVPRSAIADAKRRADAYAKELGDKKQIGFQALDRLNLECAIIVASAVLGKAEVLGKADDDFVPLNTALYRMREGGCN
jgi:putative DNA methylase